MTAPMYLGAALCYDQSNTELYKDACLTINPLGNAWQIPSAGRFDCTGILISSFYDALVAGGETNACVCGFSNNGGSWVFQQYWGPCGDGGDVCTQNYDCDGLTPVLASNSHATTTPAVGSSSSTTSPVSQGGGSSPTTSTGGTSSSSPTVSRASLLTIRGVLLCITMFISLVNTIA